MYMQNRHFSPDFLDVARPYQVQDVLPDLMGIAIDKEGGELERVPEWAKNYYC